MKVLKLHSWRVSVDDARDIQDRLRSKISYRPPSRLPRLVAGADVSYDTDSPNLHAAVVVLNLETLETVEEIAIESRATFPYVPGLLSFRELPPLIRLFRKLRSNPGLVVCDGQGVAHPRRFGIASHLGLLLDIPSIGCAKSRLIGSYLPPGPERGRSSPLRDGYEVVGAVLRTRSRVEPVFVSVGHRMSLAMAREAILRLTPSYRLPETTRRAHRLVNRMRAAAQPAAGPE